MVDVYNEWAGPCAAMMANLKKIKMEIGGDNLVLAIVGSSHNKSERSLFKKSTTFRLKPKASPA